MQKRILASLHMIIKRIQLCIGKQEINCYSIYLELSTKHFSDDNSQLWSWT